MTRENIVDDNFNSLGNESDIYHNNSYYDYDYSTSDIYFTVRSLNLYLQPIIVVIGLFGNITSFCVFVGSNLRHLSSSVYLAGLAISDSGVLLSLLMSWLTYHEINLYHKNGWCQTFVYLTFVFSFLSVWYVVSFTVERFIAICYPLKRQEMCTSWRAVCVVCSLAVFACLLYSPYLWTSEVLTLTDGTDRCYHRPEHYQLFTAYNYLDTVITFLIPFVLILSMNVRIGFSISKFYKQTTHMLVSDGSSSGVGQEFDMPIFPRRPSSIVAICPRRYQAQLRITKMLLIVSTIFLVLNLPSHAVRIHGYIQLWRNHHDQLPDSVVVMQHAFQMLYYTNFAVNFFLYSLCGRNFRSALRKLYSVPCRRTCATRPIHGSARNSRIILNTFDHRGNRATRTNRSSPVLTRMSSRQSTSSSKSNYTSVVSRFQHDCHGIR